MSQLWVDKYRPSSLNDLAFHNNLTEQLKKLAKTEDLPHLLFYGPPGSGRKTRIFAFLKEIFGPGAEKIRLDTKSFVTPSSKKVDVNVITSNYHIELTPSDVGIYDRIVVQEIIKEIAQTQSVDTSSNKSFKIVLLNEAHSLSVDAQHALRRTMEKYANNMRIIMCCNSLSKIIAPIRSRCFMIRVPSPTIDQTVKVLNGVAKKERLAIPDIVSEKIAIQSERNLRAAVIMLEAEISRNYPVPENTVLEGFDWQDAIVAIAKDIIAEQTPSKLLFIRKKIYELLTTCIPPLIIIKVFH
ncbi:P-loop containing nucleoside triphosphate hydrolase protein, partial [Rozella allomycis CSF55]